MGTVTDVAGLAPGGKVARTKTTEGGDEDNEEGARKAMLLSGGRQGHRYLQGSVKR